jgi:hypothetical protein
LAVLKQAEAHLVLVETDQPTLAAAAVATGAVMGPVKVDSLMGEAHLVIQAVAADLAGQHQTLSFMTTRKDTVQATDSSQLRRRKSLLFRARAI